MKVAREREKTMERENASKERKKSNHEIEGKTNLKT